MYNVPDYHINADTGHLALSIDPADHTISRAGALGYTLCSTLLYPITFVYSIIEAIDYLFEAKAAQLEASRIQPYEIFGQAVANNSFTVQFDGTTPKEQYGEFPQIIAHIKEAIPQLIQDPTNKTFLNNAEKVEEAYNKVAPKKLAKQLRHLESQRAMAQAKRIALRLIPFVGVWLSCRGAQTEMNETLTPAIEGYNAVVGSNKDLHAED